MSGLIMLFYFGLQSSVVFNYVKYNEHIGILGYSCFLLFVPFFVVVVNEFLKKSKEEKDRNLYMKELNDVLISQSHNELFYEGKILDGSKILTKEVIETINTDRCSVWLYGDDEKKSIVCQQLYVKSEDNWYQNLKLLKKNHYKYFDSLSSKNIIIADDAETNTSTSCLMEKYLKPMGIKSMLDVPIIYRGDIIGVICVESLTPRKWVKCEVDFVNMLSSIYSFAHSVKESNLISNELIEFDKFVNHSVIVSKADSKGRITYVNKRFEEVSGWSLDEVLGKDHIIVNSDEQPDGYWSKMYEVVLKGGIWNDVVTNRTKLGDLYYVDTHIRAIFDSDGKLSGFSSIRQDVTEIIKSTILIEKKNTYLEHAAKILRHDMHSGINTYIPRGLSSLERRLNVDIIKELKIESPIKMIKEGLKHTQKVYKGVYEFTNLVKKDVVLNKSEFNLKDIILDYLSSTAYVKQVVIDDLPTAEVNDALFCTAVDNLIRNGLKYNDSDTKIIKIYFDGDYLYIQDNGRGMTQEEFDHLSKPYTRKDGQKESGTGLGLNICVAILNEHGFFIKCEKNEIGTKIKIKIK